MSRVSLWAGATMCRKGQGSGIETLWPCRLLAAAQANSLGCTYSHISAESSFPCGIEPGRGETEKAEGWLLNVRANASLPLCVWRGRALESDGSPSLRSGGGVSLIQTQEMICQRLNARC